MDSENFRIIMNEGKGDFETLKDILTADSSQHGRKLIMLIVGKRPAPRSVKAGHYFQGKNGRAFWNLLKEHGILQVPEGQNEDVCLLRHGYGIVDLVKTPGEAGDEPGDEEYRRGMAR